ncbi:unnamed protein product [Lactuca saligna]|uniref:Uncharacterized protein n=1 Tax=Lactuca saligna TaxID=75948 RepID=A0AA35YSS5_LACSI|nr:unnamed protein product [Lactuca saligna]
MESVDHIYYRPHLQKNRRNKHLQSARRRLQEDLFFKVCSLQEDYYLFLRSVDWNLRTTSAEEEVDQTFVICKKKTACFLRSADWSLRTTSVKEGVDQTSAVCKKKNVCFLRSSDWTKRTTSTEEEVDQTFAFRKKTVCFLRSTDC